MSRKLISLFESRSQFRVDHNTDLYTATAMQFSEFLPRVTWFTPTLSEARGHALNVSGTGKARILLCHYVGSGRIATPEQAGEAASQIFPDEPLLYSMFDESIGEFDRQDVRALVSLMRKSGFDGAVHPDYSAVDSQEDAFALCIFNAKRDIRIIREIMGAH